MAEETDLLYLDQAILNKDAPELWKGAPPNWGKDVVSHIDTVAGAVGFASHAYMNADEAIRHDPENSERMRADCGIMECLEARYRAAALCNWHLEPPNNKSASQKDLCERVSQIIETTPDFVGMRLWLSEAVYFGRSGVALRYGSEDVGGHRRTVVDDWEPRHGDKFAFRYDDGSGKFDPKQVGIRVSTITSKRLNPKQCSSTSEGYVYWFTPQERKTFILHKHLREDGPYNNPWVAGRIHGVGVRTRIYWTWYAMVECLQRALEFLDRAAFGVQLWRYPGNSAIAKKNTEEAAKRVVSGGRSVILVPTFVGDNADSYGVEHIEPGVAGLDRLLNVIKDFFGIKIKRYILGQTLTSEADATGMGSGVADAHMATFADIVSCDAQRLAETLTRDFVRHIQLWNFPGSEHIRLKFKIDTESDNVKEKLEACKSVWDMGAEIKTEDLFAAAGLSMPTAQDAKVFNPQLAQAIRQMQMTQAPSGLMLPNGAPDPIAVALQGVQFKGDPNARFAPAAKAVQKESYSWSY